MSFSFGTQNISRGNTYKDKPTGSTLPLYYKDKPNKFRPLSHTSRTTKHKLIMLFKAFIYGLGLYAIYHFAQSGGLLNIGGGSIGFGASKSHWAGVQAEVRQAMLDSWHTYEKYGWGYDVYHPIKQTGENMGKRPLGWMIVDSLDTLMLMDAKEEVNRAKKWIKEDLDYVFDQDVNVFETTIRMLGGLLSAFHLSQDDVYLDKAVHLANLLHGAYKSPSGIPYASVNLETGDGIKNHVNAGASSTAEAGTVQLEMKYLAKLTGEADWWQLAEKVMQALEANKARDGLVPIFVNPETGKFQGSYIRLGSRGDSYYEYLLKQYLQTNSQELIYWEMYRESVEGVKKHLVKESYPNKLKFIGELEKGIGGGLSNKMDHLVCFYGGLLALGATEGKTIQEARKLPNWNEEREADFKLGEDLTYTCYKMYHDVPATGLSPEIVVFNTDPSKNEDFYIKPRDRHNLQRPETVESLFYLYRITGDNKYRKWGEEIFENFMKYTKVVNLDGEVSFSSLQDVTQVNKDKVAKFADNTESFWWAETLKYLYLLFDDTNKIPLTDYVFNTEAHPFPKFDLSDHLKTGWRRKIDENQPPRMLESKVKIDKQKLPEAQPVNKPLEEEAKEAVKENPELAKDENIDEKREKLNKIIENLDKN